MMICDLGWASLCLLATLEAGNSSQDMFSFGVLLYLLVTGSHPFLEAAVLTHSRCTPVRAVGCHVLA